MTEIEWQLEGTPLGAVRRHLVTHRFGDVGLGRAIRVVQRDVYWDTAAWNVHGAGWALRTRRTPGVLVATLKECAAAPRGPHRRRELSAHLPARARASASTLAAIPGALGARLRSLARGAPLRPLFVVITRRQTFPLHARGRRIGEIALDRTTIARTGRVRRTLERVEVESAPDTERTVAPWVAALRASTRLRAATASKFEVGLRACRLRPRPLRRRAPRARPPR